MITIAQIIGVLAALFTLALVVEMLRRRRLRERHAIWWLLAGIMAIVIGLFPSLLDGIAMQIGIEIPINLIFFVSVAVLFVVNIQNSSELTSMEEKTRLLAEEVALLKNRVEQLEKADSD